MPRVKVGDPADEKAARDRAVERARAHLAEALRVRADEVSVVSSKAARWSDASLGCPEPDRMYAQVVTDGYQVILKAGDESYEVHVAGARAITCKAAGRKEGGR